jgi:site-specific DNA-adenine methylase
MQSPHKEDYIQTIMHLDERSQHALVEIVQNAIGERMVEISRTNLDNKLIEQLQELTNENELLREEIKEITANG